MTPPTAYIEIDTLSENESVKEAKTSKPLKKREGDKTPAQQPPEHEHRDEADTEVEVKVKGKGKKRAKVIGSDSESGMLFRSQVPEISPDRLSDNSLKKAHRKRQRLIVPVSDSDEDVKPVPKGKHKSDKVSYGKSASSVDYQDSDDDGDDDDNDAKSAPPPPVPALKKQKVNAFHQIGRAHV